MVYWREVILVVFASTLVVAHKPAFIEDVNENISSPSARILSGWEAEEGQFPYQISLRMVNRAGTVNACGGSIIHQEWGLTAAHCTAQQVTLVVRAGAVNLTSPEYIFETTEYLNHPSFRWWVTFVQTNDIGLIKFNQKLAWSWRVQPIRLQSSKDMDKDYSEVQLVANGYGRTWTNGASTEHMNWVYLRGITNNDCWNAYNQVSTVVESTICAIYYNVTSQSTCQGDSGGVLSVVDGDGVPTQVGVTSFVSSTGCHTEMPTGFIRPGHYHDWFTEATGINFDWDPSEIILVS